MDKLIGFVCGIGFLGGVLVGALLNPGMGVVGCLAALVCGAIGAVCFPVGLGLLGLLGYGLYEAYEHCRKPAVKVTEQPKPEIAPTTTCNPNAQGAKLVSSLTSSPKAQTPLLTAELSPATIKPIEQPGIFNRVLSFFGWRRDTSSHVSPVENVRRDFSR